MSNPSEINNFSRPGSGAGTRDMGPPDFFYSTCPARLPQLFRRWSRGTNRRRCAKSCRERQGSKSRRNRLKHGFWGPPCNVPSVYLRASRRPSPKVISHLRAVPAALPSRRGCRPRDVSRGGHLEPPRMWEIWKMRLGAENVNFLWKM